MAPLGLLLLLLMGIGTVISWRRATWKNFKRNFIIPIASTVIVAPSLLAAYWYGRGVDLGVTPTPNDAAYAITAVVLITFVTSTIVEEFWRGISARMRMHGESIFEAAGRLTMKQRRRYGGYIIHLGILCAFLAFAGNALKIEHDVSVKRGESIQVGDYTLKYKGLTERNDPEKLVVMARVDAYRDGELVWELFPGKAKFYASPNAPTSEIDIKTTVLEDLYVALVNFDPSGDQAAFKVFVAPFTWWFWFGGVILIFGTMIAMWPTRESIASLRYGSGALARIALVGGTLLVSSLPLVLAAVETYTPWGNAQRWQIEEQATLTGDADPSTAPPDARSDS
jgi:cytochrome c-type biogenesis protein CcmF